MVRWLALALLWLVGVGPALARPSSKYIRYSLPELCFEAESIVVGRITSLDSQSFEFAVTRHVAGTSLPERVRVQRCSERTYARRWAPYAVEQELLLFLKRETFDQQLRTVGGLCQGELPLFGAQAGFIDFRMYDIASERIELETGPRYLQRVPLSQLEAVILYVREHFAYVPPSLEQPGSIVPRVSTMEIEEFAKSSEIAWHAVNVLYSSHLWNGPSPETGPRLGLDALARVAFAPSPNARVRHLASLGDFDKDGFPDAIATLDGPPALALVHGSPNGVPRVETIQVEFRPDQYNLGSCVPLGDLDGDGRLDFVLHTGEPGLVLLSLAADGRSARWKSMDSLGFLRTAGIGTDAVPTDRIAALGDLDGDGSFELAVHLETRGDPQAQPSGSLAVVSLNRQGEFVRARLWKDHGLPLDAHWTEFSLVRVGDVDGDGVTDVAWGVRDLVIGNRPRGALWIVFLERDGSVRSSTAFSPLTVANFDRPSGENYFASSVGAAGDVDGDSIPDLVASSTSGLWILLLARDGSVRSVNRLLNPVEVEPADAQGRRVERPLMQLGLAIGCSTAPTGRPPMVFVWANAPSPLRSGVLAIWVGPDGAFIQR